jgi:hypothetical protein
VKHIIRMETGRARVLSFAVMVIGVGILAGQTACYRQAQPDTTPAADKVPRATIKVPPGPFDTLVSGDVRIGERQSHPNDPNYPNPFSFGPDVHFRLDKSSEVVLKFYNASGDCVRTLCSTFVALPGEYHISWSGADAAGDTVPSGVYFYRLKAGEFTATKKVVFMR